MKTKHLFLLTSLFFFGAVTNGNAQATSANSTNTITSTHFLGSGAGVANNLDVLFKRNNVAAGKLATTFTNFGVNSVAVINSVSLGLNAGQFSTATGQAGQGGNTYIGQNAGKGSATAPNNGRYNAFIGFNAGSSNTTGFSNFYGGAYAGSSITTGISNVFLGNSSGLQVITGNSNVYLGASSGYDNTNGNNNVFIGSEAGIETLGSNNIFIGTKAGLGSFIAVNNQLYINGSIDYYEVPLIWGDFAADQLKLNGKVGIGTVGTFPTNPLYTNYKLFVTGGILTDEIRVAPSASGTWADYVFAKDYNLKPLSEVEQFIKENGHLPNVPSAAQIKEEGINVGDMARIQQEKIEELTLYIIAQNKRIEALEAKMNNK